jgi:hypothetical protein
VLRFTHLSVWWTVGAHPQGIELEAEDSFPFNVYGAGGCLTSTPRLLLPIHFDISVAC